MKFVIDIPETYIEDSLVGKVLRIPFLMGGDVEYFPTNVVLEPYKNLSKKEIRGRVWDFVNEILEEFE